MIVNPQFVGTTTKGSQVTGKELYDSFNNRRLEERQNKVNAATDAQAEWDARIEPAIMDMMRSTDPRVRAAAEQRYIQLRAAKARAFNQRYGEGDAAADLESLRARYADGGLRNDELMYSRERSDMLNGRTAAPAQGGGGGGSTKPEPTPNQKVGQGQATPEAPGAQTTVTLRPSEAPRPLAVSGIDMGSGLVPRGLAQAQMVDPQKELEALAAQMLQKEQDPMKLQAAAASFAKGGDQKNATAARMAFEAVKKRMAQEAAATSQPLNVRDPSTGKKAMFAAGGQVVPGQQGEPVQAILADGGEPELVIPFSHIKQYGPLGAIAKAMQKPPVVGGQQAAFATGGVAGDLSREEQLSSRIAALPPSAGPSAPATSPSPAPQAPAPSASSAPPQAAPGGPGDRPYVGKDYAQPGGPSVMPDGPVTLPGQGKRPEPLLSDEKLRSGVQKVEKATQGLVARINAAASSAEASPDMKDLAKVSRVLKATPEFKELTQKQYDNIRTWFDSASPEDLIAAGMKDAGEARLQTKLERNRMALEWAKLDIQKAMLMASGSEKTRTVAQEIDDYAKARGYDIMLKDKYKGDIKAARRNEPEYDKFCQMVENTYGTEINDYNKGWFLGIGTTITPVDKYSAAAQGIGRFEEQTTGRSWRGQASYQNPGEGRVPAGYSVDIQGIMTQGANIAKE